MTLDERKAARERCEKTINNAFAGGYQPPVFAPDLRRALAQIDDDEGLMRQAMKCFAHYPYGREAAMAALRARLGEEPKGTEASDANL